MISGPVMIQVLEGENAIAKNRELMGATDPEEGRARAPSAPISPTASTPTPCTAPTPPRPPRSKSPSSSRHEHLLPLSAGSTAMTANLLDFDLEGLAAFCESAGREALSRDPAVPLDPPARRARLRRDDATWPSRCAKSSQASARIEAPARHQRSTSRADGTHQVAVRRRRRRRRRGRVHPRGRPRHAVRLVAGRLRRGLPLLLHRPPGLLAQPHHRRDRGAALVCRALPARAPEAAASASSPTW